MIRSWFGRTASPRKDDSLADGSRRARPPAAVPPDMDDAVFLEFRRACAPYSMTSIERMFALYGAVCHVLDRGIPGDFVECGVWRGGSAMMIAHLLAFWLAGNKRRHN